MALAWPNPASPGQIAPRLAGPRQALTAPIESSREGCPSVLPSATLAVPLHAVACLAGPHRAQPCRALPSRTGAYTLRMPSASAYLRFKSAVLGPPVANAHKFAGIRCDLFNVPQV